MKEKNKQNNIKVGKKKSIVRNNMIIAMILGPAILVAGVALLYAIWWLSSQVFSWVQEISNVYVFPWIEENWIITLGIWAAIIIASVAYQIISGIIKNKNSAKKVPENKEIIYEEIVFADEETK